ncbi:putative B3 domain-containing protein At5g66980 isoform X2 [Bidens hawaiensis]|uniref:putative B3 domain-containing protein At5g66980 isoform X2 n=1 Tax=Bidens hawaiensis TaxID=980011 RepID=UPI004049FF19
MAHRRFPCFFKILLDPSAPHLPLPPDFVKTHMENNIPEDPILRSATGGYSWNLKIKQFGESWCLSDGWDIVVQDINLGFGDFLVFSFDCKRSFKLVVFSPNGCEKDSPPNTLLENNNININNNNLNNNNNNDVNDNSNISDSGIVDDDVEDDVSEDVYDDDDDEDEMDDDDDEEEEEDEVGYEEKDDGDDDDDEEDGGYIDGHDGDPFFMVVITKGHKCTMRMPTEFTRLAGIDCERTLTVANLDGKEWELGVRFEKLRHVEKFCLSSGWPVFRRSNDVSEGDECVFKFIRNEDKLLLARVSKSKRPAKTPEREVVKRKRKPTERNSDKKVETRASRGVKEAKRPPGRPFKRPRGRPARRK